MVTSWIARIREALFPVVTPPARIVVVLQQPEPRDPTPPPGSFLIGRSTPDGLPVMATEDELDRHLLILGATGTGKTTLIARLFDDEVQKWQ